MPNVDIWKIHVLLTYTISELSFNFFGGDFWGILKFSIFVHLYMYHMKFWKKYIFRGRIN
jgi:hypothetical protein